MRLQEEHFRERLWLFAYILSLLYILFLNIGSRRDFSGVAHCISYLKFGLFLWKEEGTNYCRSLDPKRRVMLRELNRGVMESYSLRVLVGIKTPKKLGAWMSDTWERHWMDVLSYLQKYLKIFGLLYRLIKSSFNPNCLNGMHLEIL